MKKDIVSERNLILRNNLYHTFTYLCSEFSMSLRPRNRPTLFIPPEAGVVTVQDKQSIKYFEQRQLPLPKLLGFLLEQMRIGFNKLKIHIAKSFPAAICYEYDDERLFFLFDEKGHMKDFMLTEMRKLLYSYGLPSDMPNNFPRHYAHNYIYRAGIANDLIDAWHGHQHAGRELTNIASPAMPERALNQCLVEIEIMLEELGFEELPYLPKGFKI